MDERDSDREPIDRVILGTAGEDEHARLEDRLFADDGLLPELQDREDALIDDYVHGRLPEEARAAFERRFLSSARGRERVAFARAAARHSRAAVRRPPAWLSAAAAAVFAVTTAALGVRTLQVARDREDERSRFATREQQLTRQLEAARRPAPVAPPVPAIVLGTQGTRDSGTTPELARPAAGPVVIAVPVAAGYASYSAVLRTAEGALAWEDAGLHPDGATIRLEIPDGALPPGDYILTVAGRKRTGPAAELADHYFRVVR